MPLPAPKLTDMGSWSSLPHDLVLAIFSALPSDSDKSRFRSVCSPWRSTTNFWRPRPWLITSHTTTTNSNSSIISSCYLTPHQHLLPFTSSIPVSMNYNYLSSSNDYLAISPPNSHPKTITLLNPISNHRVTLPPITFFKNWADITKIVLSHSPKSTSNFAAVAVCFPTNCIAYYNSGDKSWSCLAYRVSGHCSAEYHDGKFYVAFRKQVCVCEIGEVPAVVPIELVDDFVGSDNENDMMEPGDFGMRRIVETHLVRCGGELLLVSVWDDEEYNSDNEEHGSDDDEEKYTVEVHCVQFVGDRVKLVKKRNFDGYAVFLGRNHAFALSPSEFPACRRNCVYMILSQGRRLDGAIRVVDMERAGFRYQSLPCPLDHLGLASGWARHGWFFPSA